MGRKLVLAVSLGTSLCAGCFNPNQDTVLAGTTGGTQGADTAATSPVDTADTHGSDTQTGTSSSTATTASDTSSSLDTGVTTATDTGTTIPDWGEGEPPDFGDLGAAGSGDLLLVHALGVAEPVDVWLAGSSEPLYTGLQRHQATRIQGIPRAAQRVIFARTGTLEAVGCSQWLPLRADEQWAVVAARAPHDCVTETPQGATLSFEQARPLSGNPLRFVHAATPDPMTISRGGVAEPGVLEPLTTLDVDPLPNCGSSGCQVGFQLANARLALARDFTFLTREVADVPPAGEVLLIAIGNIRHDWPATPEVLNLLRVDIDGTVDLIERDPELAALALNTTDPVEFRLALMPGSIVLATVEPCGFGEDCPAQVTRFAPGNYFISASSGTLNSVSLPIELRPGQRTLLVFTTVANGSLTQIDDSFDHQVSMSAIGRGFNALASGQTLTLGRSFGGQAQAFDAMVNIASLAVSDEQELPVDNWQLLYAVDGGELGIGCFASITTYPGWRGLIGDSFAINLEAWPATTRRLALACF